jgi:hypothetical protein
MDATHTMTVQQYQQLINVGVLTKDDRIELLEERIVPKAIHTPLHDSTRCRMAEVFFRFRRDDERIRQAASVELADSQPEPDFSFVKGRIREYETRYPNAQDTRLVVEIADNHLEKDRTLKQRIYARAEIAVYWIINLIEDRIEVFTQPSGPCEDPAYANCQMYKPGQSVPLVLDGQPVATIPVDELIG